jgi:hypothetical protein
LDLSSQEKEVGSNVISINVADGGEDDYAETRGLLFDAGSDAQANGVPFDERCQ